MAKVTLTTIKNWFKTGLRPSQAQFWDTWDSFWHKDQVIPVNMIDGLSTIIINLRNELKENFKKWVGTFIIKYITLSSGSLEVGLYAIVYELQPGDDFSNVGYVSNNDYFKIIGEVPNNWTNGTMIDLIIVEYVTQKNTFGQDPIVTFNPESNIIDFKMTNNPFYMPRNLWSINSNYGSSGIYIKNNNLLKITVPPNNNSLIVTIPMCVEIRVYDDSFLPSPRVEPNNAI